MATIDDYEARKKKFGLGDLLGIPEGMPAGYVTPRPAGATPTQMAGVRVPASTQSVPAPMNVGGGTNFVPETGVPVSMQTPAARAYNQMLQQAEAPARALGDYSSFISRYRVTPTNIDFANLPATPPVVGAQVAEVKDPYAMLAAMRGDQQRVADHNARVLSQRHADYVKKLQGMSGGDRQAYLTGGITPARKAELMGAQAEQQYRMRPMTKEAQEREVAANREYRMAGERLASAERVAGAETKAESAKAARAERAVAAKEKSVQIAEQRMQQNAEAMAQKAMPAFEVESNRLFKDNPKMKAAADSAYREYLTNANKLNDEDYMAESMDEEAAKKLRERQKKIYADLIARGFRKEVLDISK